MTKINIIPNLIFILAVIIVPVFIMLISSVGAEAETLRLILG
ncbi:MAG: hypothetical protein ABIH48_02730 [Candidatus Falkowbacteria bacterium]